MSIISCKSGVNNNIGSVSENHIGDTNAFATGFKVTKNAEGTLLSVMNPWQKAQHVEITYQLSKDTSNKNSIHIPVKRVVCLSTTHIAYIDVLGNMAAIKAISGTKLVCNPRIINGIKHNTLKDVGFDQSMNYEVLLGLKPDVVFAYNIDGDASGTLKKLEELGLKVVLVGEYLESNPLAKAEWIKFFAPFFEKETKAAQIFDSIATTYMLLKKLAAQIANKPKVAASMPWNGTWYISGGKSYAAQMIADAGGDYVWNDLNTRESEAIDFETVIDRSCKADFWINLGSVNTISDIVMVDKRLEILKPVKTKKVFNNNKRLNAYGGNDYWESGTLYPQRILNDLISIFHPELTPGYTPYYYMQLK